MLGKGELSQKQIKSREDWHLSTSGRSPCRSDALGTPFSVEPSSHKTDTTRWVRTTCKSTVSVGVQACVCVQTRRGLLGGHTA